jgi:hypothetical protein
MGGVSPGLVWESLVQVAIPSRKRKWPKRSRWASRSVAKLEKRGEMHVGNLRRYVEALRGTLEITAHFAGTTIVKSNLLGELTKNRRSLPWLPERPK